MKSIPIHIMLGLFPGAMSAQAFELKNPERGQRLKIEIEPAPPVQQDFDIYVRELAAAAQRDAKASRQEKDRIDELQAKALNPLVLFRW